MSVSDAVVQAKLLDFVKACEAHPDEVSVWIQLCEFLYSRGLLQEAHDVYFDALKIHPESSLLHLGLGVVFDAGGEKTAAEQCYRNAIKFDPANVAAWFNLSSILQSARQYSAAIDCLQTALKIDPEYYQCYAPLMHFLRQCCRWHEADEIATRCRQLLQSGVIVDIPPFSIITLPDVTPVEQQLIARRYVDLCCGFIQPFTAVSLQERIGRVNSGEQKIRLGFLSADFYHHATSILLVRTLELLDRNRFELFAYSSSPDDQSDLRRRIIKSFDHFSDITLLTDEAAAQLIRDQEIDILLDLKGFTSGSRMPILAYRPAPVQINYLGYPATMDRRLVDYLIADNFVIPVDMEKNYVETVLRLPHCYQPNDALRQLPGLVDKNALCSQYGLPPDAIVLGAFQQNYKIHPALLNCWVNILLAVPDAVLWCMSSNVAARSAIENFFTEKGVLTERIFWAEKVGQQDHLDRLCAVDLVLDSWPVNGHTSTADALWAGTPVLTLAGETFVSRVAGSLLFAAELPHCVTFDRDEYVQRAIAFCQNPEKLRTMRVHLQNRRQSLPLFNSERYTRDLEILLQSLFVG